MKKIAINIDKSGSGSHSDDDRQACIVASGLLAASRQAGALALLALALEFAGALMWRLDGTPSTWPVRGLLVAALAVAACERYLALRIAFDQRLFYALAQAQGQALTLSSLDTVLARWGVTAAESVTRSVPQRVAGALRLVRWHMVAAAAQLLVLCGIIVLL